MGQHADVRRTAAALLLALAAAGACTLDEAALVDPGGDAVTAATGQLRVLSHDDDPTAGDDWRIVLAPDPTVVDVAGTFRERDSRTIDDDEPGELRRRVEAVGAGSTLLVEVNCVGCRDGVPTSAPDADVLVWRFVVDGSDAVPSTIDDFPMTVDVGDPVVIVRDAAEGAGTPQHHGVLARVGSHTPDDGADLYVDVLVAVEPGPTTIVYETEAGTRHDLPVTVRG